MLFLYLVDLLFLEKNINKNQVENGHCYDDNCLFFLKYLLELNIYHVVYD